MMESDPGKQNKLIRSLLGILTTDQVNDLTTRYCGERQVSLIDLASHDLLGIPLPDKKKEEVDESSEGNAKILPFNADAKIEKPQNKVDLEEEIDSFEFVMAGPNCLDLFSNAHKLFSKGLLAGNSKSPKKNEISVVTDKKAASTFILEEKERLGLSQKKLRSLEVMSSYKNVSSVQIDKESHKKKMKDKGAKSKKYKSINSGHLINKKIA